MLAATPDGRLQLLAPRHHGDGFARAQLIADVQPTEHPGKAPRIAALRTGYLTRPPGDLVRAPRKQASQRRGSAARHGAHRSVRAGGDLYLPPAAPPPHPHTHTHTHTHPTGAAGRALTCGPLARRRWW